MPRGNRPPKVGMIFECAIGGPDLKVCEHLARMLQPDISIDRVPLLNKPNLIDQCAGVADTLLKTGCDRVLIIWDLDPGWGREPHCRGRDRAEILERLTQAGIDLSRVHLICIEKMLEAWLLADGRALSRVLSTDPHPMTVGDTRHSERVNDPKRTLMKIYRQNGRTYNQVSDAIRIAQALPDLSRIENCATFRRFAEKVTGGRLR